MTTRLRQVALVARDLGPTQDALHELLGTNPYHDPGVAEFGLHNAVFAAGDTFLEVVSPVRDGTTAGRYLDRRGGDSGYMAIFQVDELAAARERVTAMGVKIVWQADLTDIAGTHLHPRDVPGAIVSLDWADPPESWRWAGPRWTGGAPDHVRGGITGVTVEAQDPSAVAQRWADVLDAAVDANNVIHLDQQTLTFVAGAADREAGITAVDLAFARDDAAAPMSTTIAGVLFRVGIIEEGSA